MRGSRDTRLLTVKGRKGCAIGGRLGGQTGSVLSDFRTVEARDCDTVVPKPESKEQWHMGLNVEHLAS
jgi:hypothetical protein